VEKPPSAPIIKIKSISYMIRANAENNNKDLYSVIYVIDVFIAYIFIPKRRIEIIISIITNNRNDKSN
jgi:hypothetical protein